MLTLSFLARLVSIELKMFYILKHFLKIFKCWENLKHKNLSNQCALMISLPQVNRYLKYFTKFLRQSYQKFTFQMSNASPTFLIEYLVSFFVLYSSKGCVSKVTECSASLLGRYHVIFILTATQYFHRKCYVTAVWKFKIPLSLHNWVCTFVT